MALVAALSGGVFVCLPVPAATLEVPFCRHRDKTRASRQGRPARCKVVNEKSAHRSQELLGSHLWASPLPPSGWRQGGWRRHATCPKPHGTVVTQTSPCGRLCPLLSIHNTVPTFPLFTTRISPLLSSFKNLHYISTLLWGVGLGGLIRKHIN